MYLLDVIAFSLKTAALVKAAASEYPKRPSCCFICYLIDLKVINLADKCGLLENWQTYLLRAAQAQSLTVLQQNHCNDIVLTPFKPHKRGTRANIIYKKGRKLPLTEKMLEIIRKIFVQEEVKESIIYIESRTFRFIFTNMYFVACLSD